MRPLTEKYILQSKRNWHKLIMAKIHKITPTHYKKLMIIIILKKKFTFTNPLNVLKKTLH